MPVVLEKQHPFSTVSKITSIFDETYLKQNKKTDS